MSLWWPGEWDHLISKIENWILKRNGYDKLQSPQLSRSYQSMLNKPKSIDLVCTKFYFSNAKAPEELDKKNGKKKVYTHQPSSIEVTNFTPTSERYMNSLDKMEKILAKYEHSFVKLPKRGPKYSMNINSQNIDILNEEIIQNMFLKCYNVKKIDHEIATSKV